MSESIDKNAIDQLAADMGGRDAVVRITSMYAGKLPGEVETLTEAVSDGDLGRVQSNAHRLKSSTAMLGAVRLAGLFASLEQAGKKDDLDDSSRLLVEVAAEAELVRAELSAL
jgi:HPt (histidine-containing phosphotransfer) domain-containing protein